MTTYLSSARPSFAACHKEQTHVREPFRKALRHFRQAHRRGALSEEDVNAAMREVRRALLEADVALEVVRSFVDRTRTKAVGAEVVKSVTPGQMVVKIVHDSLVETLGGDRRRSTSTRRPRSRS